MNIQQLRAQIATLQDATMDMNKNFRSDYDEGKFDALTAVDTLLDSLQEEPVNEDLEEAAHQCYEPNDRFMEGFKKGAQWQKQQDQSTIELAEDHAMLEPYEEKRSISNAHIITLTSRK